MSSETPDLNRLAKDYDEHQAAAHSAAVKTHKRVSRLRAGVTVYAVAFAVLFGMALITALTR